MKHLILLFAISFLFSAFISCSDNASNPVSSTEEKESLTVDFARNGPDQDFYLTLVLNDTLRFSSSGSNNIIVNNLADGTYQLSFEDVRANCSVEGGNLSEIEISNDEVATTSIAIDCKAAFIDEILFVRTENGQHNLYVMDFDGSDQQLISSNIELESGYSISKDGTMVAFTGKAEGNNEIYIINADGSNKRNISMHPANDTDPVWSPDNSRIAFVSSRDGNKEIYIVDPEGNGMIRVTANPATDNRPVWNPFSSLIAFVSDRNGNKDIFVSNRDGSQQAQLTLNPEFDSKPVWHSQWRYHCVYK
jgi:TolB protein